MIDKTSAVWTYPDLRQVCQKSASGRRVYQYRIREMWLRQRGLCCICHVPMGLAAATFEHQDGRGMGAGHRDDRIEKDGKPYNGAAHWRCNAAKASKRASYS